MRPVLPPEVRPVLAPAARAVRMPSRSTPRSARPLDDARPAGSVRPPLPPLPPQVGPRTTVAPFAAVPTPEREAAPGPLATALDERPPAPAVPQSRSAAVPGLPERPSVGAAAPAVPRSPSLSGWGVDEHDAPWATGRGAVRAPWVPGRREGTPLVERRASRLPAGGIAPAATPEDAPAYGDWTKPSGAGRGTSEPFPPVAEPVAPAVAAAPLTTAIPDRDVAGRPTAEDEPGPLERSGRVAAAPLTTAIPDRDVVARGAAEDEPDPWDRSSGHDDDVDLQPPASSPGIPSVSGGRAASRAERQAREEARLAAVAARRKAARRSGQVSLDDDEDERPGRPRRVLMGLVALAVVAAAVLGVYTVTTPGAQVAGAQTAAPSSTPPSAPTSAPAVTAALPPLDTSPDPVVAAAPPAPVRVPVTVLNGTQITGLAADISAAIAGNGKGWRTLEPAGYPTGDVAATTVFYTRGDEKQRQAAMQLKEQFPQLSGPAPRFFEVPATVRAPGLVVVAAGDWLP